MNSSNFIVKEMGTHSGQEWDAKLSGYQDYNLYQAYGWGEMKKARGWNVLRLICNNAEKDVAMSQCFYKYNKLLRLYTVWIPGGPLFHDGLGNIGLNGFCYLIDSIKNRFNNKRYYLRTYLMQYYESKIILAIREKGFQRPMQNINQGLTYYIDTSRSESEILDGFTSNWKHNFRRAFRSKLTFRHTISQEDFSEFYNIYTEMAKRKRIRRHYSMEDLLSIEKNIGSFGSLNLFLALKDNTIFSGRVVCIFGNKAYDLLAAVTNEGRKNYSSYFLIWEIINWCRSRNIEYLDMSGVDPLDNKGVFNFKKGIGGKFIEYVGEWEVSNSLFLRLMANLYISKFRKD